jgi:hypothetical protein
MQADSHVDADECVSRIEVKNSFQREIKITNKFEFKVTKKLTRFT